MSQVILDLSANTFKNDFSYVIQMMDEIKAIDTGKHQIIFKTQLFKSAPPNIPLDWSVFDSMYHYGKNLGYQVTSSVFDKGSLDFLLQYDVPMIKIANNRKLYYLIGETPRRIPIYVSVDDCHICADITYDEWVYRDNIIPLVCVSNYPATMSEYSYKFSEHQLKYAVSDHTSDWFLFKTYQPRILEVHYKLPDSQGLDAGSFSRTPSMLKEIL